MRGTAFRAAGLCAALTLAGCSTFAPHTLQIDSAAGSYQGVTLTYRVDGGQLSEPLTVARINGRQVTQERLASSPYPDRSVIRLSIRYPHPNGKAGFALAEMVIETHAPPNAQNQGQSKKAFWQEWSDSFAAAARDILPGMKMSDGVFEAWALDISKSDLDRVVQGMSLSGYFVNPSKQAVGVELAVRIDNFQATKSWTREPELDILMERVRQEGRLVSYLHPNDTAPAGVTYIPNRQGVTLAAHEQAGPALMPAGPQHNAYQLPSQGPPPFQPPPPAQGYAPPGGYAPPNYAPPQAMPPTAPQPNFPRGGGPLPPPYRRGIAPPSPAPGAAPQYPPGGSTAAPAGQQAAGSAAPRRFRMPWQRTPPEAKVAQPNPPPPQAGGYFDPRRQRPAGYPAAGRQPPNGWNPARLPRGYGRPYAPNPRGNAPAGGSAPMPQPPQVETPGAGY